MQVTAVEAVLADPEIYSVGGSALADALKKQADLNKQLALCEEQWMEKSEELEILSQE